LQFSLYTVRKWGALVPEIYGQMHEYDLKSPQNNVNKFLGFCGAEV